MDFVGQERITAPRDAVWAGLNDPDILKGCIPGCQSLEFTGPNELVATIRVKIGMVPLTFTGEIRVSNIDAPQSYTLSAEGRGSIAGFARGSADVTLEDDGGETILHYRAGADVGGKIAQLGAKLIDSSSQKLAQRFFSDFNAAVSAKAAE
ncbi:carbon monoxide dehydrogenase subunit G [Rhizobium sp. 16-449-1b]|uniref:SRPBCC family protein n=1 Tax=Rhizobium sp. 16-449-1b TaxID=2819989 RepID=UPI001ADA4A27|nr:carbon monoxide dehydrogenase subunit G [Rhizobium sp. 16-449-1b]MBO9192832.1 carbon monoxide dehydrogenase subunit G [Rhizobium sp. 16-449-1b]